MSIRTETTFDSEGVRCVAWLYRPDQVDGARPGPAVVLGHGLGGVKEMGLDAYAQRFVDAGYVCVVFDYRHFGGSDGEPRQLLDIDRQLADWAAAIAYTRTVPEVDADRVALFGSSFGGGHVIVAAARDPRVAAVVSQCPFTSGTASTLALGVTALGVGLLAARDEVARLRGAPPVLVPLAGPPGRPALMNAPDALPGYTALAPEGVPFVNAVAARIANRLPLYHPGRSVAKLACPILFSVCDDDTVAPPGPTLRYAAKAAQGTVRRYPVGHFDIYLGEAFEAAVADQVAFLAEHLPV